MYQDFLKTIESKLIPHDGDKSVGVFNNSLANDFFLECGGRVFKNGAYKTHTHASSFYWTSAIIEAFQEYENRIIPFGFDWMARQFAIDLKDENKLLMFDPATVEAFELPLDLRTFHNRELITDFDSYFDESKFKTALSIVQRSEIGYTECIGYKIPLFLNGKDVLENLEIGDNEVYWTFQNQIWKQIKNLPPGTKINSVRFE